MLQVSARHPMEGINWGDLFTAMDQFLLSMAQKHGVWVYVTLFAIFFSETGLVFMAFLPGDSLLFVAGAVAAGGYMDVYVLMVLISIGAILGNTLNYLIGSWLGRKVYDGTIRWIDLAALMKTHDFYERHGGKTIMIARFVPVVRSFAPLVAGASGMDFRKFQLFNVAGALLWLKRAAIRRWVGRTTWQVVRDFVSDPGLQAVLAAQWGAYGGRPAESSFAAHALVMHHYLDGAWFPVGGSAVFAREFGRTIESAGGAIRTNAEVARIRVRNGRVEGVALADGEQIEARCVVSDAGVRNTLRLLPAPEVDYRWADDALAIEPSIGYVGLYLGLEGDIGALGASTANDWIYESWDINAIWRDPFSEPDAPGLFVSFPSLKDPAHDPGPDKKHTCEIVALVDWSTFSKWDREGLTKGTPRSEDYAAYKAMVERNLLAQFGRHYPRLAPLVRFHEASTPISVASITAAEHGAMYGLQTTPERFLSPALRPRTPVGGLFLAGQDVCTPGVTGALMGGVMAAVAIEPKLGRLLH
ncbi:MAG: VTT domain-containing protein [Burkholderiaceae bacterium]|nr:VTT domain-containing protein [Burkholderiaceae bacterium]